MLDETHDPELRSWVETANRPDCEFPIQNLPLGVFRTAGDRRPRLGLAIGDSILDLRSWLSGDSLNSYMSLAATERRDLRKEWSKALREGSTKRELFEQSRCEMLLPAAIGDYTDFYASIHHATNVGRMFRPHNPLLPNYKQVPIAYHGRASSVVVSGTPVRRPVGQLGPDRFGPTTELDYEVEIGAFLGPGNRMGEPIAVAEAEQHVAGLCLLNDWSARDIQRWESQPLGPFLAKNFATSISPWMVTLEALEPFRTPCVEHDHPPLPYLRSPLNRGIAITVEVWLRTGAMTEPIPISRGHFASMYWTLGQMVAHHASNGCVIRTGDLIGSGTISGPAKENRGCLLELASNGTEPLELPNGERRVFLMDGDEVILTGYCRRSGFKHIGFGTCGGTVFPVAYNQISE